MSVYPLLVNQTTTITVPPANLVVSPVITNIGQPASYQAVTASVSGTSGNVSATVQVVVSNDNVNWSNFGTAITLASGPSPVNGNTALNGSFQFFGAIVTAISGTGAKVNCSLSA